MQTRTQSNPRDHVTAAAATAAVAHLCAGAIYFFGMQHFSLIGDAREQAKWLVDHRVAWRIIWLALAVAAFSLVWFVVAVRGKLDEEGRNSGLRLAVAMVVVGVVLALVGYAVRLSGVSVLATQLDKYDAVLDIGTANELARWLALGFAPVGFAAAIALILVSGRRAGLGGGPLLLGWLYVGANALLVAGGVLGQSSVQSLGFALSLVAIVLFAAAIPWSGWGRELVLPEDADAS